MLNKQNRIVMNGMTTKSTKDTKSYTTDPLLIYICGSAESDTKTALRDGLSNYSFVRCNLSTSNKHNFTENCIAIVNAKLFIFILDRKSIMSTECLSLLGTAVAYDIPVVAVREIGYALPLTLPKQYASTEIIDRSRINEHSIKNEHLATITTLDQILKTLSTQTIIYHEHIHSKCVKTILHIAKTKSKSISFFDQYRTHYINEKAPSPEQNTPMTTLIIEPWPPKYDVRAANTTAKKSTDKHNHKQTNNVIIQKQKLKHSLDLNEHKNKKVSSTPSPKQVRKVKSNKNSPSDIKFSSSSEPIKAFRDTTKESKNDNGEKNSHEGENKHIPIRKFRSNTLTKPIEPPRGIIRRQSSLPNIATNYLVTDPVKSEPTIYHFPMSPRLTVRLTNTYVSPRSSLLGDAEQIHLSRICSPIDFVGEDI
ncbi:uncharacterized protein LOC130613771 [Hydractinia symbiolongicarpus]|uniref:uncharacterized protein LOC130613771 n=1 Tax=Hydractinia symbiolongicarpus TaxID=13093 RepID=UPI0025519CF6|nr:uncharacterized protein LOC130613771 [Hydractinia symbiolongicarpus]